LISDLRLLKLRSLGTCRLYFRFLRVPALSRLCDAAKYLSRRLAKYGDDVVQRHFLWPVSEKDTMLLVATDDGSVGESARRLRIGLSDHWSLWRRRFAPAGLDKFQTLCPH